MTITRKESRQTLIVESVESMEMSSGLLGPSTVTFLGARCRMSDKRRSVANTVRRDGWVKVVIDDPRIPLAPFPAVVTCVSRQDFGSGLVDLELRPKFGTIRVIARGQNR